MISAKTVFFGWVLILAAFPVLAQTRATGVPVRINPLGGLELSNVVVPGQTGRNYQRFFVISLRTNCVSPPAESGRLRIGRGGVIEFNFGLRTTAGGTTDYSVRFPTDTALYIQPSATLRSSRPTVTGPSAVRAAVFGNLVRLEVEVTVPALAPGETPAAGTVPELVNPRFQLIAGSAPSIYVMQSGALAPMIRIYHPYGSYSAEIHAQFDAHLKSPLDRSPIPICAL